jgi:molybdate transport system ATP-binding protein
MDIQNLHHNELKIESFATRPGETWCFYGDNNSGIDLFISLLAGELKNYSSAVLTLPENPGIISFDRQQLIFEEELKIDDSDFLNRIDPGTPAKNFLTNYKKHLSLIRSLDMEYALNTGYRQLSSGQSKKLLFLQQITGGKTEIIIQNPYDGLDRASCQELDHVMITSLKKGIQIFLLVNSMADIPQWCSHLAYFHRGKLVQHGKKTAVLPGLSASPATRGKTAWTPLLSAACDDSSEKSTPLVRLRNGFGGYGKKLLFQDVDLEIFPGDHTLITGKNGCGKSTLLSIITGDNSKCYANDLHIFGRKRGSGESIWELKRQMGIVSPALHRDYRVPGSVLQAVLSGFFDSIGVYKKVSEKQIAAARHYLLMIGLAEKARRPFRNLSHAHQRLVLIARALIKKPRLLILDEPSQGLDEENRKRLMELMEEIAARQLATLIFVSHREDEHHPLFTQHINLERFTQPIDKRSPRKTKNLRKNG